MSINNYSDYESFIQRRKRLVGLLSEAADIENKLSMQKASENLKQLSKKVDDDTFKVLVMGTFKNGKSTFINSLLGEAVLPAYALPCTAVINEVKYGETKSAVLHFKPELPKTISSSIPEKAIAHMKKYGMKNVPPMVISYDEINNYVTIPIDSDAKQTALESPFEKVEVFYPLEILKNGVEIIDSPGLNEHTTRTEVTMGYLKNTDAVLFVLNATALCSESEMECVEDEVIGNGFENPYFIVNKFDMIKDEERDRMRKYAKANLAEYTSNEIFFVSGLDALDAKIEGDAQKLEESGVPALEKCLSDFLTKEKGKAKLVQPAREIKKVLNDEALCKVIPQQRKMLESSLDDVKARYEKAKPKLDLLKVQKEQLISKIQVGIERGQREVENAALSYFTRLADKVPAWIEEFTPKTKFGVIPTKKRAQTITNEISDYVISQITKDQKQWCATVFQPMVEEKSTHIFNDIAGADLSNIIQEIDSIKVAVSGYEDVNIAKASPLERIAAAAGGLLLGDIALATTGGLTGFSKEMAKVAAIEFSAAFILALIGLLNPFTIILVIGAAMLNGILGSKNKAMNMMKVAVRDKMVEELAKQAKPNAEKLAKSVYDKFIEGSNLIATGIDNEINDAQKQVESVIRDLKNGESSVNQKKVLLAECEQHIHKVNTSLDALILELVNA